jgi:uncharacterized protein
LALVVDTGPLFAAMDRSDADHVACAELIEKANEAILVPAPVLVEIDWLAGRRLQPDAFSSLLLDIDEARVQVANLNEGDYRRCRELMDRYRDLSLGFVDAAVMAIVERFREGKLATLDHRHFEVVRPKHVPALRLVP